MIYIEILVALLLAGAFFHFHINKKKTDYQTQLLAQHIDKSEEMKRTLAMGLYLRFKSDTEDVNTLSSSYIKQNPLMFEYFVAEVIERAMGGNTWVSPSSGDFGVDFEHTTEDGLFLGQVKCYKGDLPFDPIALVHSNMVKRGAVGGYVITTGSFTPSAREYAEGLNIELVEGVKLVELWLEGLENAEQEIRDVIPDYI
ncbi:restriction system protein [Bacillus pakistanensis]|uniref:Restriction system protein n=1 Tax=Rossellomorea pakistanensis TaxID=992288 RepID=A0ABS2NJ94_9BACI|nr:restriction endonuclease [Bacillus pakistanensis]MBM7587932.1 restriction system protein [Bacillus pakistanensis]